MPFEDELPADLAERARMMEGILIECSRGGRSPNGSLYEHLREEFMHDAALRDLLPSFVRTCPTVGAFWPYIKKQAGSYDGRAQFIRGEFAPLIDRLESRHRAPGDDSVSDALKTFDPEGVHAIWDKALSRRASDPEGAITVARTLLETVCKRILDDCAAPYSDKDDLPKLYSAAVKALNLAPDQRSGEPIKAILGSAMNLVNGIGTLRNVWSDAHGRGGQLPVRPSPRHASLAVNTAGAIAAFIVETHLERRPAKSRPWQGK